jgi:hypothetical protein
MPHYIIDITLLAMTLHAMTLLHYATLTLIHYAIITLLLH